MTQAEKWLIRVGLDDGQTWMVEKGGHSFHLLHLLDPLKDSGSLMEPKARLSITTIYVGEDRASHNAYLWPDESGIVNLGAWWDLVDMSREDPADRSESGEPIYPARARTP